MASEEPDSVNIQLLYIYCTYYLLFFFIIYSKCELSFLGSREREYLSLPQQRGKYIERKHSYLIIIASLDHYCISNIVRERLASQTFNGRVNTTQSLFLVDGRRLAFLGFDSACTCLLYVRVHYLL